MMAFPLSLAGPLVQPLEDIAATLTRWIHRLYWCSFSRPTSCQGRTPLLARSCPVEKDKVFQCVIVADYSLHTTPYFSSFLHMLDAQGAW